MSPARIRAEAADESEIEPEDVEPELHEEFDAFWAQHEAGRRLPWVTIRGVDVEAPTDLPLEWQARRDEITAADADTLDDLAEITSVLLGDGVIDELRTAGVGVRELQLLMVWAQLNGSGRRTTLAQAAEELEKALAKGKAPRRERRAQARTRRSGSGGRSARTGR